MDTGEVRLSTDALFKHVEYLREFAQIPIVELAALLGVSERTYHNWLNGAVPDRAYEPWFRKLSSMLEAEIAARTLPVHGTARSNRVLHGRRAVLKRLAGDFTNWLVSL